MKFDLSIMQVAKFHFIIFRVSDINGFINRVGRAQHTKYVFRFDSARS